MMIDFSKVIMELDGMTPVFEEVRKDVNGMPAVVKSDRHLTLGIVCANALMAHNPNAQKGQDDTGEVKAKKYRLAQKIVGANRREISVEEVALIRKCVPFAYSSPLVAGQAWLLLDPKDKKKK